MVQYLELVLKRDVASGWKHTLERLRTFLNSSPANSNNEADGANEKTDEMDWKQRFGKNWYY